jgi:bacterioferritin-associated ferredoxin
MIICSCNYLSDSDVRRVTSDVTEMLSVRQVYDCLNCNSRCGRCARTISRITKETLGTGDRASPCPIRPPTARQRFPFDG